MVGYKYRILTMTGDYPVENQAYWNETFQTIKAAIPAALEQQDWQQKNKYPNCYTVVLDDDQPEKVFFLVTSTGNRYRGTKAQILADKLGDTTWDIAARPGGAA